MGHETILKLTMLAAMIKWHSGSWRSAQSQQKGSLAISLSRSLTPDDRSLDKYQ